MKHYIRAWIVLTGLLVLFGWTMTRGSAAVKPEPEAEAVPRQAAETASDAQTQIRVRIGGETQTMDMGTYLLGVLRAEMPASFASEALKAQAVAARTDVFYRMRGGCANHPDAEACDDINCCRAFKTAAEASASWGNMAVYYEEKLLRAVRETDGEIVRYGGEPILAVFCSSTNGATQTSGAVWQEDLPYLQSVSSPESAATVPNYETVVRIPAAEFCETVRASYPQAELTGDPATWITDLARDSAGFVTSLRVGGVPLKGNTLRTLLDLRSPSFTVASDADTLIFTVTGYGHGVGMSQYGANVMAAQGASYDAILTHYYTGTSVGR